MCPEKETIKKVSIVSKRKELKGKTSVYYSNSTLYLECFNSARSARIKEIIDCMSKVPDYIKNNHLTMSKELMTNFELVLIAGYDYHAIEKAFNKTLHYDFKYLY